MSWTRKHLLGLQDLSAEEILGVLDTATSFREVSTRTIKKVPALRGKTIVNLFYEASTRTRASFELAAKRLSADVMTVNVSTSSARKGETLLDTARNLAALAVDMIVLRHGSSGAPHVLARHVRPSVINAGDGWHEHPTQALLDMLTIRDRFDHIGGLRVTIIGDIQHSRVARSNIWALTKLGAQVTVCGPPTLIPRDIEHFDVQVSYDARDAISDADVIYVLRIQQERMTQSFFPSLREYARLYRIDTAKLAAAPRDAVVMHPGPINRDVELSAEVADSDRAVIMDQVSNGLAVRMAVLYLCAGGTN